MYQSECVWRCQLRIGRERKEVVESEGVVSTAAAGTSPPSLSQLTCPVSISLTTSAIASETKRKSPRRFFPGTFSRSESNAGEVTKA